MSVRLSLRARLLTLCIFLLGISGVVGAISYHSLGGMSVSYNKVLDLSVPKMKLGYEMMLHYRRVRISLRTMGLQGISEKDADIALKDAKENIQAYDKLTEKYVSYGFTEGQKELFDKVELAWVQFKKVGDEVESLHKTNTPEAKQRMLEVFLKDCPEAAKVYTEAVDRLLEFHQTAANADAAEAKALAESSTRAITLTILVGIFLGLGIGYLIATRVARTVGQLSNQLADGADQVAQASEQIAGSSQNLAQSTAEQASALEETSATMEELTSMVRLNSENGKQAASLAASTREVALKGEREIKVLTDSIYSIAADSKKIEEITNVIDDIAFQTNLLALNAAVEAARAGEQGKGFAVVAEAVRSLAQRSSSAAKDIAELIKNSVEKIEASSHQANQGSAVLSEIVTAVKKVADLNSEIANASEEQNNGIAQIGKAMNQMDQVTQENAAASEEAAAAAEELSAQSVNLKNSVNQLEGEIFGGAKRDAVSMPVATSQGSQQVKKSTVPKPPVKVKPNAVTSVVSAQEMIPFDDGDGSGRKVGSIEGF